MSGMILHSSALVIVSGGRSTKSTATHLFCTQNLPSSVAGPRRSRLPLPDVLRCIRHATCLLGGQGGATRGVLVFGGGGWEQEARRLCLSRAAPIDAIVVIGVAG